jgi:probable HAF family extracellular repeat protein
MCNALWVPNKRSHQFLSNVSVSFGGITVKVDPDVGAALSSNAPKAKPVSLTYAAFSCSGASDTEPAAISNMGTIVGSMTVSGNSKAFIYKGVQPCAALSYAGATDTEATGVNDKGQVIGIYYTNTQHGFFYDASLATPWTILNYPNSAAGTTYPTGINDAGLVVGVYGDTSFHQHGFLYDSITKKYTTIDVPGMQDTMPDGINGLGQIVGESDDASFTYYQFLYNKGVYTTTSAAALQGCFGTANNSLMIIGAPGDSGCLYQYQSHAKLNINYPGATGTYLTGINDFAVSGATWTHIKMVGTWYNDKGGSGAFTATFK